MTQLAAEPLRAFSLGERESAPRQPRRSEIQLRSWSGPTKLKVQKRKRQANALGVVGVVGQGMCCDDIDIGQAVRSLIFCLHLILVARNGSGSHTDVSYMFRSCPSLSCRL